MKKRELNIEMNDVWCLVVVLLMLYLAYVVYDIVKGIFEDKKEITYDVVHECWYYNYENIDGNVIAKPVKKVCTTYILCDQKVIGLDNFKKIQDEKLIEKHPKFKQAFIDSTMRGLDSISDDWQDHYDGYMYVTKFISK